jgi:uncharacterized protein YbaA (DUF1428 family)
MDKPETYVEALILPVRKDGLDAYWQAVRVSSQLFLEYGALSKVECLAADTPYGEVTSFPRSVLATEDEVVVLSWIVFPDKATRDSAVTRMMKDPRLEEAMKDLPVDGKRMIIGGFTKVIDVH